mgnify:CR=1 FL=1
MGLLGGVSFASLSSAETFQSLFYYKTDKFLVPSFNYWILFGLTLASSFILSYWVAFANEWLQGTRASAMKLLAVVSAIVGLAPTPFLVSGPMRMLIGVNWDLFIAPVLFLFAFSISLCLLVSSPGSLVHALFLNAIAAVIAIGVFALLSKLVRESSYWFLYLQWSSVDGLLLTSSAVLLLLEDVSASRRQALG